MRITVEDVVRTAQDVGSTDPIDWGMLAVDEESAYRMIAASMVEHYESLDPQDRDLMLLATATKLVVENFVLNLKLSKPL